MNRFARPEFLRGARIALVTGAVLAMALAARAQDSGPLAPPPKFEVHRVSNIPHPGPPPIPAAEIIQKFAANEDIMKKQYQAYDFTETIRVDESGSPGGKLLVSGEIYTKPDGQRFFRVNGVPQSTLLTTHLSLEDLRTIASMPLFVLTTDELPNYNLTYVGDEKLDELHTWIFQVKPKQLSRKRRFFDGVVWIDDRDFAVVKSYGHFVSDIDSEGASLPFKMFETYRENFEEKYWLPTYTSSEEVVDNADDTETRLKLVIHDTNFKLHSADVAPPEAAAVPANSTPVAPSNAAPKSN